MSESSPIMDYADMVDRAKDDPDLGEDYLTVFYLQMEEYDEDPETTALGIFDEDDYQAIKQRTLQSVDIPVAQILHNMVNQPR